MAFKLDFCKSQDPTEDGEEGEAVQKVSWEHQDKDVVFIMPPNAFQPGLLTLVEEKATFLSYVPHVMVTFSLREPFLQSLWEGNSA